MALMIGSSSPPSDDDFRSVFSSEAELKARRRSLLTEAQLVDRIEEELRQLDEKRLALHTTMRALQEAPYNLRHNRAVEQCRHDAARISRRIHSLFQQQQQRTAEARAGLDAGSPSSPSSVFPPDETSWLLYYQQYAAITDMLNAACLTSLRLQQQYSSSKQPQHRRGGGGGAAAAAAVAGSSRVIHRRSSRNAATAEEAKDGEDSGDEAAETGTRPLLSERAEEKPGAGRREEFMRLQSMVNDVAAMFDSVRERMAQDKSAGGIGQRLRDSASLLPATHAPLMTEGIRYRLVGMTIGGASLGALLGGPVGAVLGAKSAMLIAAGGVGLLLGGVSGGLAAAALTAAQDRKQQRPASTAALGSLGSINDTADAGAPAATAPTANAVVPPSSSPAPLSASHRVRAFFTSSSSSSGGGAVSPSPRSGGRGGGEGGGLGAAAGAVYRPPAVASSVLAAPPAVFSSLSVAALPVAGSAAAGGRRPQSAAIWSRRGDKS